MRHYKLDLTLPDTPVFNEYGIWEYRDIAFSKYGNLKETVIQLIIRSEKGLMAREIAGIVGIQYQSYLSHFRNSPKIQREKINDIYIYFASDPHLYQTQKQCKEKSLTHATKQIPNDMEAIMILVDWIKHPRSTIKACCKRIRRKKPKITVELIRNLFDLT